MTNLVEHVLDVAKLSAGQLVLSPSKVDLNALIHDVMARYREPVRRSKSEIRVECRDSIVGFWDRRSMEKVVTNLLTNAIKFGRGNPIDVTVTHDDGSVRLVVVDRGEGMTEETQQRIFERFERAVSSEHYGGLGMGLWVVRQLVKAHGGSIRVFSVRDVGSTFTVTVPVDVTDAAHGAPASVLTAAPFLDDVGLALRDLPSEFRNGH
jgi:signal transduction histidine kinase